MNRKLSRRALLQGAGVAAAGGLFTLGTRAEAQPPAEHHHGQTPTADHALHGGNLTQGDIDLSAFNPTDYLTTFDYGEVSSLPSGQTLRTWKIVAFEKIIEVAPGVTFPAWTYNGQVPGPTLRCTEGDRLRIHFVNAGAHPHSMHFHGIHTPAIDGSMDPVAPGGEFVYEFDAEPFGLHLYHCHVPPLRRHLHRGLYGVFIVDPPTPRPPARELVMVMNAFDTDLDGQNEIYALNTVAFHFVRHPIRLTVGEPVRLYVVNLTEFDPVNSLHTHANFFKEYRTGTSLVPNNYTDITVLGQAERAVLELSYRYAGMYMFHPHQTEFTELGWSGTFEVGE